MDKKIGIDLGTSNTRICVKNKGTVLNEATVIAFSRDGQVVEAGDAAKKMLGKAPPDKDVVTPLSGGVIANFDDCVELLYTFLGKLGLRGLLSRPKIAVSVPCGITEVERNAFENVCIEAGGRDVFMFIKQPMAAAVGCGTDVLKTKGRLICDIGGGSTQTSVISYRGIIRSSAVRVAGNDIDDAIIRYMRDTYNVVIGRQNAENVKLTAGSAHRLTEKGEAEIYGRNMLTGQVSSVILRSGEIREAITPTLDLITEHIKSVLEDIPPELSSDVFDTGLTLCGGTALLPGIDRFFSEKLGMSVKAADDPLLCVCRGTESLLDADGEIVEAVSVGEDDRL